MFRIILLNILFFGIPVILVALFGISLYRYSFAKKQNKRAPGTFLPKEIKKRKILLIVFSVVAGVIDTIFIGLIVLLSMAVANM